MAKEKDPAKVEGYKVQVTLWEESERGWGTRPDGYTLHIDQTEQQKHIDKVYEGHVGPAPDCYTKIANMYTGLVDEDTYNKLKREKTMWGDLFSWRSAPIEIED